MQSKKHFIIFFCFIILLLLAAGTKETSAALTYSSKTDSFESDKAGYYAIMKADVADVKSNAWVAITAEKPVSLSDFSIQANKDVFICFSEEKPKADQQSQKADLKIGKAPYDKLRVTMDFTSIDLTQEESKPEEKKKNLKIASEDEDDEDEIEYESAVALIQGRQGKDESTVYKKGDGFLASTEVFLFSTNQSTWREGKELNSLFLRNSLPIGATVYIKVIEDNARPTKPIKVKLPKQEKAPSIRMDVNKLTLNLKNGMDFASKPSDDASYINWFTILPYHKEGRINQENQSIVAAEEIIPLEKKDSYDYYTTVKFKGLNLESIPEELYEVWEKEGLTLLLRKSATYKKFASASTEIQLSAQAKAPVLSPKTEDGTLATSAAFQFVLPSIANDPLDKAQEKYEMAVVDMVLYYQNLIDWTTVKWKPIKAGAKINGELKSKYHLVGVREVEETEFGEKSYLLVRRKGIGKQKEFILPSKPILLNVCAEAGGFTLYQDLAFEE